MAAGYGETAALIPTIQAIVANDGLRGSCAIVGRFYGEGLLWALALPLPDLIRWQDLIPSISRAERNGR